MKFTKAELEEILNEYKDKTQNIEKLDDFRVAVPPVILKSLIESVIGLSEALELYAELNGNRAKEALEKWGVGETD